MHPWRRESLNALPWTRQIQASQLWNNLQVLQHIATYKNLQTCRSFFDGVLWRPGICQIHVLTPGAALASFLLAPISHFSLSVVLSSPGE